MPKGKILVVDDSKLSRTFCTDILVEDGFEVETASTGMEALGLIAEEDFDLVILDLVLPDIGGQDVLKRSKQTKASTNFIVITGHASLDSAIESLKSGASDYLTKPLNPEEFKIIVNRTIDQRRLFDENKGLTKLVKLYEISKVISSCLDYERFHEVLLDSILQVVEGTAALSIAPDKEPADWRLAAFRADSEETAKTLADALISHIKQGDYDLEEYRLNAKPSGGRKPQVTVLESRTLGLTSPGTGAFLLIPIKQHEKTGGYLALFRTHDGAYSNTDIENASFIANQASISLENIQTYNQTRELTYIDDLTKLHNVRYLDAVLENEIKRAKRFSSHLSLLFIDIDFFKNINDNFGHRIGSNVLVELGRILREVVREIDTVVRYGGDEFTILLVETDSSGALIIADRIRDAVEKHLFMTEEGLSIRLTITTGVATYPEQATTKENLLTLADTAMYKGKKGTRNVVVVA